MISIVLFAVAARAEVDVIERAPVPEPILTETVTDIDGHEADELEFEASGSNSRAVTGGAYELQGSVEGEWLVTNRFGVRGEAFFSGGRRFGENVPRGGFGMSFAGSVKLVRDLRRDFYLQVEAAGRVPFDAPQIVQPGEATLPIVIDLRAAWRRAFLTFRGGFGVEAGRFADVPLRTSLGIFTSLGHERFGFVGLEFDGDFARRNPVVLALDVVPSLTSIGLPFKLGFALPLALGVDSTKPSIGFFFRIVVESSRELEYGARHG